MLGFFLNEAPCHFLAERTCNSFSSTPLVDLATDCKCKQEVRSAHYINRAIV